MSCRRIVKNITLLSLIGAVFGMSDAMAAKIKVDDSIRSAWGAPASLVKGFEHNLNAEACVGDKPLCAPWVNGKAGNIKGKEGTATDSGSVLMLVAHDMNEHGAKFCVTQVQVSNYDRDAACFIWAWGVNQKGKVYTTYYSPTGAATDCFWLCKDGHYGDMCSSTTPSTAYDTEVLNADRFKGYKRITSASAQNIEDTIPMFYMNDYAPSNYKDHDGFEHDMFLGITRWTTGGHGAWVAPVSLRSGAHTKAEDSGCGYEDLAITSTPILQLAANETLVCMDGYHHNAAKTDCIPFSKQVEEESNALKEDKFCLGYDGYDSSWHTTRLNGDCYEYRCIAGYGFKSATDHTCVECAGEPMRFGIAPNGVCVICPTGTYFDANATGAGHCPTSIKISSEQLAGDCWHKTNLDEYKSCVLGVRSEQKDTSNVPGKHPTTPMGAVTNFSTQITNNLQPSGNLSDLSTLGNGTTSQTSGTTIPGPNINPATYDIYKNIQNSNLKQNGTKRYNN